MATKNAKDTTVFRGFVIFVSFVANSSCLRVFVTMDVPKDSVTRLGTGPSARPDTPSDARRSVTASDFDDGGFTPGTLLLGRYRIVGLIGRGGMGEVYRAQDLTLGQSVALKILPEAVQRDASRLERFLNEVRIARQISHPNVCRVYDVADVDGRHFLSMGVVRAWITGTPHAT